MKASQPASIDSLSSRLIAGLPPDFGLLFITIDTLRYDLGYAGNPRPVTPNLDRLAQRSVVFEKAYALASYTGKSVGPLMIGKYPSETHRGWRHFNVFSKRETFIQERLQRAAVRTVSIPGFSYLYGAGVGLERGFDVIERSGSAQLVGDNLAPNSDKLSAIALRELGAAASPGRRFFIWVHYTDPHADYVKHEKFDFGAGSRARYDSEVAFVDEQVGRVLDRVLTTDLAGRTAIVVTSDHGEAFGEHGMIRHGFELWEELVRVPLLIYVPGVQPRRISERRGAIDLVPTFIDLFQLPRPAGEGDDFVSGKSLIPDLVLPAGEKPESRSLFIDMPAGPYNSDRQALIEGDLKLITSDGRPLGLYDLAKDPAEKHDLLDDRELRGRMLALFKAFRRQLKPVRVKPEPAR